MADAVIILAGGAGSRLWPASVSDKPKQFLSFGSEGSLLRRTVDRAAAVCPEGRIVVVTHVDHLEATRTDLEDCRAAARTVILAEPRGCNTAPAIAYGVHHLGLSLDGSAVVLVLAADHLISPLEAFAGDVKAAVGLARRQRLVVFGIPPREANTGYGYIQAGPPLGDGYEVRSFREKPDPAIARRYLAEGGYYWNSGMFVFTLDLFRSEVAACSPELDAAFSPGGSSTDNGGLRLVAPDARLARVYEGLPRISIDYALMEKSRRVAMIEAGFDWNDVGSWDEVARTLPPSGRVREIGGRGNFVYSDIPVGIIGCEDLIVVARNGRLLVCRKELSQAVKELHAFFEAPGEPS